MPPGAHSTPPNRPATPGPPRVRWLVVLLLALLVHGALLLWPVSRHAPKRAPPVPPVRVVILPPSEEAVPEPPPQPEVQPQPDLAAADPSPPEPRPTPPAPQAQRPTQDPTQDPTGPPALAEAHPPPSSSSPIRRESAPEQGAKQPNLFPPSVIGSVAQGSDHPQRPEDVHKPTAGERGRQNLATFDRQVGEAIRSSAPKGPRIERGVAALGQRLHGWFTPNASLLQEAGLKDVPWTALLPHSPRLEQLTGNTQYQGSPAEKAWSSAAELEESIAPPLAGSPLTQPPLLCFGACGDSHEKARLHALIAIDHLASGAPERWWIERSSGSGKFDNAALESVVSAAKFADPKALREGTRPTRSVWMFSATAYQWSRYELLLDPQFDPPGYEAEETSNLAGVTSIATSVRLVAVRYRDEPQPPASP